MANISRFDPFDDLFRGFFVRPVGFGAPTEAPTIEMDVKESADNYTVHAELPGIRKDDIHVNIDGSVVSISAERKSVKENHEGEGGGYCVPNVTSVRSRARSKSVKTSTSPAPARNLPMVYWN